MSQRVKRQQNRSEEGTVPTKRRKCRPTAAEEDEAKGASASSAATNTSSLLDGLNASGSVWMPRHLSDLKSSSIYNRSSSEAPAELFRKDLISAMKLPDSEPLSPDEYWVITDQWKQEWERGVQVPVNPDSLPQPSVTVISQCRTERIPEFRLPKNKYIRITSDEFFSSEEHYLSNTPTKAEKACSYDLDDCDLCWLQTMNGERALMGLPPISEDQLEHVIEELEIRCWEKIQTIVKTEEGLGIEYDENVICDVCRSPDSEEGNEMVFCDSCNICVHQACYGITTIPSGSWLCRTCALGLRPECVLCPNKGGAMKCTRSGQKWAHVSCALWIPEVSIGCVERMEPITKISSIPQSRWALICVLCRERVGACIQCSVKTCKTAYHVTCAFKHGLEMKAIIEDENADDGVKLRSYCQKHSVTSKKDKSGSGSEDDETKRKKRKDMTSEEKNQARAAKLQEIEAEFFKHVSPKDVTQQLDVDAEGIQFIYNYWKLKRKAGFNKPLLAPRAEDVDILTRQQEQADLEKMRMFVQLRQDLERVRNLCYMVSRREKLSRSYFKMREQTFHKQVGVLVDEKCSLSSVEMEAVIQANHGPSIYDHLYSHADAEDHMKDFDLIMARISGSAVEEKKDLNGLVRSTKKSLENPYKRMYFNGASRRRHSLYDNSLSSGSETDGSIMVRSSSQTNPIANIMLQKKSESVMSLDSESTTEEEKPKLPSPSDIRRQRTQNRSRVNSNKSERRNKKSFISRTKVDSSSEEESKPNKNVWPSRPSRTLRQMERELSEKSITESDSDGLLPIKSSKGDSHKVNTIYSDSDSEVSQKSEISESKNEDKSSNTQSDNQQHILRTKAAVKEFSTKIQTKVEKFSQHKNSRSVKTTKKIKNKDDDDDDSMDDDLIKDKENVKASRKKEYDPTDLIVPQRQAAKKATECIRYSQGRTNEKIILEETLKASLALNDDGKAKRLQRQRAKEGRESRGTKDTRSSSDIYDFDKDLSDPQEILAYVPQRQAAKKAAEHIKSGMVKPVPTAEGDPEMLKAKKDLETSKVKKETDALKVKKESDITKLKKDNDAQKVKKDLKDLDNLKSKKEQDGNNSVKPKKDLELSKHKKESDIVKVKKAAKIQDSRNKRLSRSKMTSALFSDSSDSSTSSTSASSSSSSSSSNESEEEEEVKPAPKPLRKDGKMDKPVSSDKKSTPDSFNAHVAKESNESVDRKNKTIHDKKSTLRTESDWPFLDKADQSDHSSSEGSESEDDDQEKDENKFVRRKPGHRNRETYQHGKAAVTQRNRSKFPDSAEGRETDSKLAGKKFKRAPDKKLKTSDGRPELGFQPPFVERDEPRAKEELGKKKREKTFKKSRSSSGDRFRNADGGPRDNSVSESRDSSERESSPDRGWDQEPTSKESRNRTHSTRIEEQKRRERESSAEKRSNDNKKEQSKYEGRTRKSIENEEARKIGTTLNEKVISLHRTSETAEGGKEGSKSSDHSSASLKKAEEKVKHGSEPPSSEKKKAVRGSGEEDKDKQVQKASDKQAQKLNEIQIQKGNEKQVQKANEKSEDVKRHQIDRVGRDLRKSDEQKQPPVTSDKVTESKSEVTSPKKPTWRPIPEKKPDDAPRKEDKDHTSKQSEKHVSPKVAEKLQASKEIAEQAARKLTSKGDGDNSWKPLKETQSLQQSKLAEKETVSQTVNRRENTPRRSNEKFSENIDQDVNKESPRKKSERIALATVKDVEMAVKHNEKESVIKKAERQNMCTQESTDRARRYGHDTQTIAESKSSEVHNATAVSEDKKKEKPMPKSRRKTQEAFNDETDNLKQNLESSEKSGSDVTVKQNREISRRHAADSSAKQMQEATVKSSHEIPTKPTHEAATKTIDDIATKLIHEITAKSGVETAGKLPHDKTTKPSREKATKSGEEIPQKSAEIPSVADHDTTVIPHLEVADDKQKHENASKQHYEIASAEGNLVENSTKQLPEKQVDVKGQSHDVQTVDAKVSEPKVTKENIPPALSPPHQTEISKPNISASLLSAMPHLDKAYLDPSRDMFDVPEHELYSRKVPSIAQLHPHKQYQQRSPYRDKTLLDFCDFLDFDRQGINDDGFINYDTEPPLSFSFDNQVLFKEDSKEDNARETLNLVEKLRLDYAKKSTSVCSNSTVQEEMTIQQEFAEKREEQNEPEIKADSKKADDTVAHSEIENVSQPVAKAVLPVEASGENEVPGGACGGSGAGSGNNMGGAGENYNSRNTTNYPTVQLDVPKGSVPGREKLDKSNTAQADERWVPPSGEFIPTHETDSSYLDLHRGKWADNVMIPSRRSSSSSLSSSSSGHSHHRDEMQESKREVATPDLPLHVPYSGISSHTTAATMPTTCTSTSTVPYSASLVAGSYPPSVVSSLFSTSSVMTTEAANLAAFMPGASSLYPTSGPPLSSCSATLAPQLPFPPPLTSPTLFTPIPGHHQTPALPQQSAVPFNVPFSQSLIPSAITSATSVPKPEDGCGIPYPSHLPLQKARSPMEEEMPTKQQIPSPSTVPSANLPSEMPPSLPYPNSSLPPPICEADTVPVATPFSPAQPGSRRNSVVKPTATDNLVNSMAASTPHVTPPPSPAPTMPIVSTPMPAAILSGKTVDIPLEDTNKKSPAKPTRASARFVPNKFPLKREESLPTSRLKIKEKRTPSITKVPVNRSMYNPNRTSTRGRGAGKGVGRGRGKRQSPGRGYSGMEGKVNSVPSELVGTVYDFDQEDEVRENVENLRMMRERRRSTDVHDSRKSSVQDDIHGHSVPPTSTPSSTLPSESDGSVTSNSVKYSNLQNSKLRYDVNSLQSPPPSSVDAHSNNMTVQDLPGYRVHFPDLQPPLPGPVDMRTYSSNSTYESGSQVPSYQNQLFGSHGSGDLPVAFSSTASHLADYDEDLDRELVSALAGGDKNTPTSKPSDSAQSTNQTVSSKSANQDTSNASVERNKYEAADAASAPVTGGSAVQSQPSVVVSSVTTSTESVILKTSLSDSRNQLKVKIKGPFLDANYTSASSRPPAADISTVSSASSGTSNLRRMRKKELLRQYWNQDMNMDDGAALSSSTSQMTTPTTTPVNRTVITIPKAVASMTSIPTKEDYKAVVDANMEKKRKKEKAVPRELRHLDISLNASDDYSVDKIERRRSSVGSTNSSQGQGVMDGTRRGRGRPPKARNLEEDKPPATAPKLKIKLRERYSEINIAEDQKLGDDSSLRKTRSQPPKKRLQSSMQKLSVEDLKRESMKFREQIMADFDEEEKKESLEYSGTRRKRPHSGKKTKEPSDSEDRTTKSVCATDDPVNIPHVEIIQKENVNAPKLIIRIGKRSASASVTSKSGVNTSETSNAPPETNPNETKHSGSSNSEENRPSSAPSDTTRESGDNSVFKVRTSPVDDKGHKVTPIRLKLSRRDEGYVIPKTQETTNLVADAEAHSDMPTKKGCEVR